MSWDAELAHEVHVEGEIESTGDLRRDRDTSPGKPEHDPVVDLSQLVVEELPEEFPRMNTVSKLHHPQYRAVSQASGVQNRNILRLQTPDA